MRAIQKLRAGDEVVALVEIAPTALPAKQHVRVEVAAAGICGTDLHIIDGSYSSRPPVTLGHEVSGVVTEVSPDVDPAWIGARVTMETFFKVCGACEYCRSGHPNMCGNRFSIGSGVNGGFAENVVVPVNNLHRLPDWLPIEIGSICEPLACVCQSMYNPTPAVKPGDRVLVLGPGAIGLLAAQVARAAGGSVMVVGTDRDQIRMDLAAALGFDVLKVPVAPTDLPAEWAGGPDVVIECSGSGHAMRSGLELIRKRGRYVQIGQTADLVSVPLALVSFKEIEITGGFASTPPSWNLALSLIDRKLVDLAPLVSASYPLEKFAEAFNAARRSEGVKILFLPNTPAT